MGASNALAAYALYAAKVPPTSMTVLVYMALVSKDSDTEPWWSQGHAALAVCCLGAAEPVDAAALRAVRRAITPLFGAGAITVDRHSSGHGDRAIAVKYRLWLTKPAPDENRPVHNPSAPDENRPTPTTRVGRKVSPRRTKSGQAPDENRPPKEYEEYEERIEKQEYIPGSTPPASVRAREHRDDSEFVSQPEGKPGTDAPLSEPANPANPAGSDAVRGRGHWRDPRKIAAEQADRSRAERAKAEAMPS